MPTTIVAATCPLPDCNLAVRDVETLLNDLASYAEQFLPDFARKDQAAWAHRYLQGLLSEHVRKSIEPIALAHGFSVRGMQVFIGESPWSTAPLVQRHQLLVAQSLAEDDAVILVDESGMPKQGQHSVGVAPQYCGALGKLARAIASKFRLKCSLSSKLYSMVRKMRLQMFAFPKTLYTFLNPYLQVGREIKEINVFDPYVGRASSFLAKNKMR